MFPKVFFRDFAFNCFSSFYCSLVIKSNQQAQPTNQMQKQFKRKYKQIQIFKIKYKIK